MKNELLSSKARYRKGASILERWQGQMREGRADPRLVLVRISGLGGARKDRTQQEQDWDEDVWSCHGSPHCLLLINDRGKCDGRRYS